MTGALPILLAFGLLAGACGGGSGARAEVEIAGGLIANATASDGSCSPAPAAAPGLLGEFPLDLGGLHYQLRFLTDHQGPGTYRVSDDATFVALNGEGPGWSTLTDDAGKLTVNRDGRSGMLDVWLAPEPSTKNAPIHVTGTWTCPAASKTGDR